MISRCVFSTNDMAAERQDCMLIGKQARLACTTAWIANPLETCQLLDELAELNDLLEQKTK